MFGMYNCLRPPSIVTTDTSLYYIIPLLLDYCYYCYRYYYCDDYYFFLLYSPTTLSSKDGHMIVKQIWLASSPAPPCRKSASISQ